MEKLLLVSSLSEAETDGSRDTDFNFPDLLGTHRAPPQLPDEIIEIIFLRIPPDDHERLLCAALVCKHCACLIASTGFRRRYRERHRTPPLLGFLGNLIDNDGYAHFIPLCPFRPVCPDRHDYRAEDARHGRVLLNRIARYSSKRNRMARWGDVFQLGVEATLIVWDPVTDEQWPLPPLLRDRLVRNWIATVLCGSAGPGACDHLGCCPGQFRVVFVGIGDKKEIFSSVYSSGSATWSEETSLVPHIYHNLDEGVLPALVGNALYFMFQLGETMLKYDLATGVMSVMLIPLSTYPGQVVPMAMDDSRLGLAEVDMLSNLRLWSWEVSPDGNVHRWVSRFVELPAHLGALSVIAVADAVGVVFLYTVDGLYTFNLKSEQATKVFGCGFHDIIPFVSFYTPVLRAALHTGEEPSAADASSSSTVLCRNKVLTGGFLGNGEIGGNDK